MLSAQDADALFEDCQHDLQRAVVLAEDCVTKSAAVGGRSCATSAVASVADNTMSPILVSLQQWQNELMIQDVLSRVLGVVVGLHGRSVGAPPDAAADRQRAAKRWCAVMQQLLQSLQQTARSLSTPQTSSASTVIANEVEQLLVAVIKYVWAAVFLHVSVAITSQEDRSNLPVLLWLTETARIAGILLGRGRQPSSPFLESTLGALAMQQLLDMVHCREIALLTQGDDKEEGGDATPPAHSEMVLGGYASLVCAVGLYAAPDIRSKWLIRDPILDPFASKVRSIFMDGSPASLRAVDAAVKNLMFVIRSCTHGGRDESGAFLKELWGATLNAMEASCLGRGRGVLASRRGLAQFLWTAVYQPLFGMGGNMEETRDPTTLTAQYRLLRLIGDLGESELHSSVHVACQDLSAQDAQDDVGDGGTAHPPGGLNPPRQELHRRRYRALLDNTNGVLTMEIVSQLVHDRGVMIEATSSRSEGGHVVHRMFLPDGQSNAAGQQRGAGRLARKGVRQQWVFVDKGILFVKRQGAAEYSLVGSIEDLLQPFQCGVN